MYASRVAALINKQTHGDTPAQFISVTFKSEMLQAASKFIAVTMQVSVIFCRLIDCCDSHYNIFFYYQAATPTYNILLYTQYEFPHVSYLQNKVSIVREQSKAESIAFLRTIESSASGSRDQPGTNKKAKKIDDVEKEATE